MPYAGRGRPASYCSKSCRNRAWEVRSAEPRLQRDIAAGVVRTEPVREVIRQTVVETRLVPQSVAPPPTKVTTATTATARTASMSRPIVTEGYDDGPHLERAVCTQDPPADQSMHRHYGTTLSLRVADSKGSCTP